MLSLNQKSLILLIVLLIITPLQANISDSKSYQAKGVSTTINTGINGGDLADNLLKAYTTALIDIGAKKGANWIGDRYALNSYTGGIGSKNYWIHKGLHAGLGCATASAKGQDCASGAMGGAAGEMFAEIIGDNRNLSDAEILAYSRIATGFMAQATGHDVNAADGTASNVINNNYFNHRGNKKSEEKLAEYKKKVCGSGGNITLCKRFEKIEKDKFYEVGVKYNEIDKNSEPVPRFNPEDGLHLTDSSLCLKAGCLTGNAITAHEIRHAYDYRYDRQSYDLDETDADNNPLTPIKSNGIEDEIRFLSIEGKPPVRKNYDFMQYWWKK